MRFFAFWLIPPLLLVFLQAASAQPAILNPSNRTVPMDPATQRHRETVRGAPLQMTALVFPEKLEEVRCGNCTNKEGDVPQNWFLSVSRDTGRVYLKPTRYPDGNHPFASFLTTVYVVLESGYSITVDIRLARLSGNTPPDAEVVFTLPESATLSGRLREQRAKQDAEYAERLKDETTQRLLDTLLGELSCRDLVDVPYQDRRLYVRAFQVCTVNSSPPTYWVVFEVENRTSAPIELRSAVLADDSDADPLLDDATRIHRLRKTALRFDERARGIALTTLAAGQSPPNGWALRVEEEGGGERVVVVSGLEF